MTDARGLELSGSRFRIVYRLASSESESRARAQDLCVEQTIEFPLDLVTRDDIRESIVGRLDRLEQVAADRYDATISYADETVGSELTQLLNVIMGNTSLKPGVRVERLELSAGLLERFRGPRFGRVGLRELCGALERPLLCTALKPMGLGPRDLARFAGQFARGGIDIIKDDHGLADQPFCPFEERVARCAEAVVEASEQTGEPCRYAPNITAPSDRLYERAAAAKRLGAGAVLIAPGLVGFDSMRALAADDALKLPVICHPALMGSALVDGRSGWSHGAWLGQLPRLAGADAIIFPSYGGRFSFSPDDCRGLVAATACSMGSLRQTMPVPAGGMSVERAAELLRFYGRDVMLLIGGDLHRGGPDLTTSCRRFRDRVVGETSR